jgi:tRNA-dihydrouridine synthase B
MVSIGGVPISGKLCLAPMAGVADAAFRAVCRGEGAAYAVSEMISAKALMLQDAKTRTLLKRFPEDTPLGVQLFGSEPETMADAAKKARDISGCEIIDINMGCPVGKVVRNGEGSALMRDLPLAGRILEAVVKAADVPVTVKFRKGWDKGSVNAVELARLAEKAGVSAVCVHGRTRTQSYSGRADWEIIREVKASVSIPVIANGDVFEPEDVPRILEVTGADLVMIGRGAMGNPWLFSRGLTALEGRQIPPMPAAPQRAELAEKQFRLALEAKGEKIACLEARKHLCWYLRGVPYASYAKGEINKAETAKDVERCLKLIRTEL